MTFYIQHPAGRLSRASHHENFPPVNIKENELGWEISVAAPGRNREDFRLELKENKLSISYEEKHEEEKNEKGYSRKEFGFHSFRRSFQLPDLAAKDQIRANYDKGILTLSVPKKEEEKPEVISIEIA